MPLTKSSLLVTVGIICFSGCYSKCPTKVLCIKYYSGYEQFGNYGKYILIVCVLGEGSNCNLSKHPNDFMCGALFVGGGGGGVKPVLLPDPEHMAAVP